MKSVSKCLAIAVMIMTIAGVYASAAPGTQTPKETMFQGTLVKVDVDAHILTMKATDGHEWYFNYGDDTKVVGPAKDVEGLLGKPGATLKIMYRVEGDANRATNIEVMP